MCTPAGAGRAGDCIAQERAIWHTYFQHRHVASLRRERAGWLIRMHTCCCCIGRWFPSAGKGWLADTHARWGAGWLIRMHTSTGNWYHGAGTGLAGSCCCCWQAVSGNGSYRRSLQPAKRTGLAGTAAMSIVYGMYTPFLLHVTVSNYPEKCGLCLGLP